jgi:hypothetical protein
MGRKKKISSPSVSSSIKKETIETILAIMFIVVAILLLLATVGQGGMVGQKLVEFASFLFGIGFYLIPVILILLGISFFKEIKNNFATHKIIASVLLFVSGLALVNLISEKGGVIGSIISKPLISLFDYWASIVITFATMLISLIFVFEASIKVSSFRSLLGFKKKEKELEDQEVVTNIPVDTKTESVEAEEKEEVKDEDEDKDVEITKTSSFGFKSKKGSGLIFFSGNTISKKEYLHLLRFLF